MAGEAWGWPTSYFPPSEAKQQVFGAKPNTKIDKSRGLEVRRVSETSENSRRTHTRVIIECSNDDVQVLRTVKNGVSTESCNKA